MKVEVIKYTPEYEDGVMELVEAEGDEWGDYWKGGSNAKYRRLLGESATYVAVADGAVAGFCRSRVDGEFCVYICDLLVSPRCRGHSIGRRLMEVLWEAYPAHEVYVMSDVDEYYQKLGYDRAGTVFRLKRRG